MGLFVATSVASAEQNSVKSLSLASIAKSQDSQIVLTGFNFENLENPGTGEIDPADVERAVDFASSATGVRKDFLMGMLVVESDLGRNTGKCTYREVEADAQASHERGRLSGQAWQTFQERRETIKDLASKLGYDYESLKVSCNPPYNGTGGAMGIPQFMPDTWLDYRDKIVEITGKQNPDPWNVRDGVVAMAVKLADVPGVTEHNIYAERNAAKMYLSGNTSGRYDWYANQVVYWSRNYHALIG